MVVSKIMVTTIQSEMNTNLCGTIVGMYRTNQRGKINANIITDKLDELKGFLEDQITNNITTTNLT